MSKLDDIKSKFIVLKEVGERGEELVTLSERVITNMRKLIAYYEEGMKSPSWSNNLEFIGGSDAKDTSITIYTAIKEALHKIDNNV